MMLIEEMVPSTHTTLFWRLYDVVLTLWTLYRRQNDVVCLLGYDDVLVLWIKDIEIAENDILIYYKVNISSNEIRKIVTLNKWRV